MDILLVSAIFIRNGICPILPAAHSYNLLQPTHRSHISRLRANSFPRLAENTGCIGMQWVFSL
ncbi:hypothetical protein HJG40_14625 [Acidithiobacillus sp. ATCC 19703]|uniref:Uncharacterized protein n=1 Tax=Acidithiobacillus concretivorus TaxID=3063952 RepID=A0ABS5ZTG8_9PROT|nr:hypothetical protein [Acidithiobacillus concretivorus]